MAEIHEVRRLVTNALDALRVYEEQWVARGKEAADALAMAERDAAGLGPVIAEKEAVAAQLVAIKAEVAKEEARLARAQALLEQHRALVVGG
jgi:hypothetical protein